MRALHGWEPEAEPLHTLDGLQGSGLQGSGQAERHETAHSAAFNTAQFAGYLALGFGITAALIAVGVLSFCCVRWRRSRARRVEAQASTRAAAAQRQAVERVQAMIAEKRRARAPQPPILVVQPGGGAVVAFKVKEELLQRLESDAGDEHIKAGVLDASAYSPEGDDMAPPSEAAAEPSDPPAAGDAGSDASPPPAAVAQDPTEPAAGAEGQQPS